jgi:hypothetical protein
MLPSLTFGESMLKSCLSIVLILIIALYLGVYVCAVGGVVVFIDAVKATPTSGSGILWGTVRFFLSVPVFFLVVAIAGWLGLRSPKKR